MILDLARFYRACNPSRSLINENEKARYYIDFSSVRGGKLIEELKQTISLLPEEPTCQLFAAHIGCGKSQELQSFKAELEEQGFYVVFCKASLDLEMADVDIFDILLMVTRQVSASLQSFGIQLKPRYLTNFFNEIKDILQLPVEASSKAELSVEIGKITAKTKDSYNLRRQLRQYLKPRTEEVLEAINEELLGRAIEQLKRWDKKGLVVIIDELDRVDVRPLPSGRMQPEHLFIDQGTQLRRLNCHVVYAIPLALMFSNEYDGLKTCLGGGVAPKVLPMVPVRRRDGSEYEEGIALLRQVVLVRAFPDVNAQQRLNLITEVFDSPETLDRLCGISGGHVRNLLGLLFDCIREEDPPFSPECLEKVIDERRNTLASALDDHEWDLLFQVAQQQSVRDEAQYQTLLRSMFVFEYQDEQGRWFGVNPVLLETEKFKSFTNRIGL